MHKKAYSYIRFSTPELIKGDSLRRQLEGSRQWADEHGYELDTSLRGLGADKELLQKRNKVYELAKKQNPKRWSGNTRNWQRESAVWLNPEKKVDADVEPSLLAA